MTRRSSKTDFESRKRKKKKNLNFDKISVAVHFNRDKELMKIIFKKFLKYL